MLKDKPNWIEITPAVWVNLKRANVIKLKGGGVVQIDGEDYTVKQSMLETIERWLRQREMRGRC